MNDQSQQDDDAPSFDDLGLSDEVRRAIDEMGFAEPTPVQAATVGPAREGHDLIVQARTGTGKTAAFGLPLVDGLVQPEGGPQALILAPTRELALQSSREIGRIGAHTGIRTAAVYGGAPIERQVRELEAGAQIVSGTPGRVLDHLKRGTLNGDKLRFLVLDEADEMLSMGFAKELNAIVALLPTKRQTMLFSATIDDAVERMSARMLRDPERISLSSDAVGAQTVTHYYYLITGVGKSRDLAKVLENEDPDSALIFCNTRVATERLANELQSAGFNADWLNGDLPQSEREKVLKRTREGSLRYLVATDVAARGIDISHVTHVINFDFPENIESYIHRTGRTGRAGRTGTAISLVSPQELGSLYYLRLQYKIFPIERSLPTRGEEQTRREMDRIELLSQAFPGEPNELDRAVGRRLLTHPDAERLLGGLLAAFFGTKTDVDEEAAAARRERPAEPAPEPAPAARAPKRAPRERAPKRAGAPDEARGEEAREASPPEEVHDGGEKFEGDDDVFLYVNVGRRDGIRPGDIIGLLVDHGALDKAEVGRIRIRDRHTFVGVPRDRADELIDDLHGTDWRDGELVVERARAQP
ncbi:MAG TPA: DEAD/DEAH box helicase [Sandaracinaceae bacterium LLY-WYZ-13_1]|nr:DEAD/DEAH box helicase [Sandaracinaceae bacterium LLY-WYZ-13_1]